MKFLKLYDDALSTEVIQVSDCVMTLKLKEITINFSEESISEIIHVSCEYASTYKYLGIFLRDFCYGLEKEKTPLYIHKGSIL